MECADERGQHLVVWPAAACLGLVGLQPAVASQLPAALEAARASVAYLQRSPELVLPIVSQPGDAWRQVVLPLLRATRPRPPRRRPAEV